MDWGAIFGAIPHAATRPMALAAYAFALTAYVVIALRVRRYQITAGVLEKLPAKDRRVALQTEMGTPLPPQMTAEEFLRYKQRQNLFAATIVLVLVVAVVLVIGMVAPPKLPAVGPAVVNSGMMIDSPVNVGNSGVTNITYGVAPRAAAPAAPGDDAASGE